MMAVANRAAHLPFTFAFQQARSRRLLCSACAPSAHTHPLSLSLPISTRCLTRHRDTFTPAASLIPAAATAAAWALKRARPPAVQREQGGGWAREALVVLRLFHACSTSAHPPPAHPFARRRLLGLSLLAALLRVRVKLRRLRYCISTAPSSPAPGPPQPVPRHHRTLQ